MWESSTEIWPLKPCKVDEISKGENIQWEQRGASNGNLKNSKIVVEPGKENSVEKEKKS